MGGGRRDDTMFTPSTCSVGTAKAPVRGRRRRQRDRVAELRQRQAEATKLIIQEELAAEDGAQGAGLDRGGRAPPRALSLGGRERAGGGTSLPVNKLICYS